MNREYFENRLRYGDDCPLCGRPVKATVESWSKNGPLVYNSECSQYGEDGHARYIFHQEVDA